MTITIIGLISGALGSIVTVVTNHLLNHSSQSLQDLISKIKIYQDMVDDFRGEMDKAKEERDKMREDWERVKEAMYKIANDVCIRSECNLRIPMDKDKVDDIISGDDNKRSA